MKTRIGYDHDVVEEWVSHLLEVAPVNISIHGRTLEQMYTGAADWDVLAKASKLIRPTATTFLGNGDVKTLAQAQQKMQDYDIDGVLIGRGAFGNPWVFTEHEPSLQERFAVALEHSRKYEELYGDDFFHPMRKHLGWYMHGFPGAKDLRVRLLKTNSSAEAAEIFETFLD